MAIKRTTRPSNAVADRKSIRAAYDIRKKIECLSVHPSNKYIAFGCYGDIKILRLDGERFSEHCGTANIIQAPGKATKADAFVTDLAWSHSEIVKLAVVNSFGEIKCYNFSEKPAGLQTSWGQCHDKYLTKVAWQGVEGNIVATGSQFGFVRLFDMRTANSLISTHQRGSKVPTRDIKFFPNQPEIFAEGSDNGELRLWDQRRGKEPFMSISAHRGGKVSALDWSKTKDYVLATASTDKTIKIWDASTCNVFDSVGTSSATDADQPVLLSTIRAPTEVGKVLWRSFGNSEYLLSCPTVPSAQAAEGAGYISIWNERGLNIPVCVLRGHGADPCTAFDTIEVNDRPYIVSGSRDNKVILQDAALGYFSYSNISSSVPAISSQGHVAFHRSAPEKITLGESKETFEVSRSRKEMNRRYADLSQDMGRVYIGLADFKDLEDAKACRRGAEGSVFDPAMIYLLAKGYKLATKEATKSTAIRSRAFSASRNPSEEELSALAEPSPSTTRKQYGGALSLVQSDQELMDYQALMEACKTNYAVAHAAGLRCRASVWASVMALAPSPSIIAGRAPDEMDLPFAYDLLAELLKELSDGGDSQHFVLVCEVVRRVGILRDLLCRANISSHRTRQIYMAYIELLRKLELFPQANHIINASDDEEISKMSRRDVDIHLKCATCRKELPMRSADVLSATVWCKECRACVSNCSYCNKPVVGLLQWCPVCSHGGHFGCLQKWFSSHTECPTGCSHHCCSTLVNPSQTTTVNVRIAVGHSGRDSKVEPSVAAPSGVKRPSTAPTASGQVAALFASEPVIAVTSASRPITSELRTQQLLERFGIPLGENSKDQSS